VVNSVFYIVAPSQRGDMVVALRLSNPFAAGGEKELKELWHRRLDNQKIKYPPVIYGDGLVLATNDVYAFNLADGKDSWKHGSYNRTISSLMEEAFANIQADGYSILTPKEKEEIRKDFPQIIEEVADSPTIIGDFIYAPTVGGEIYAFSPKRKTPFLFWVYQPTANIIAPPIEAGGKICVGSTSGAIYILDREDGAYSASSVERGEISGLVADGESIYVTTTAGGDAYSSGKLDKLRLLKHSGKITLEKDWQAPLGLYETIFATPAILKDTVYIAVGNKFIAIDGKTKERLWKPVVISDVIHPPFQISGAMAYISTENSICGVDLHSGDKLWEITNTSQILSGPSDLRGGMLWIGTEDGEILAISQDGNEIWRQKVSDASVETTPVVGEDGTVYVACANGEIVALDGRSGVESWRSKPLKPGLLTPILLNKYILAISQDGDIYALLKDIGKQDWSYSIEGTIKTDPVVVDDVIYLVSHEGTIYALNPALMLEW